MQQPRPYRAGIQEAYDYTDTNREAEETVARRHREDQRRTVEIALLSTPQGRDWIWQFLIDCRTFEAMIHSSADYAQGFENGKREIGLSLMRRLARSSPDNFATMLTEHPDE